MAWLMTYATVVISTALSLQVLILLVLAYYTTGAPAARYELHRLTLDAAARINGGPVAERQPLIGGTSALVRTIKHPLAIGVRHVAWVNALVRHAGGTVDERGRRVVYDLLANTRPNYQTTIDRLLMRELEIISAVVNPTGIDQCDNLNSLNRVFRMQERARRSAVLRHLKSYTDSEVLVPLIGRSLDFIGRGTAAGLLVGVIATYDLPMEEMIARVGTASLVGGAIGAVFFVAYLLRLLPPLPVSRNRVWLALDRVRQRHPWLCALVITLACAGLVELGVMAWGSVRGSAPL